MRHFLTAAAAIAACGLIAATAARAEPAFEAGGPIRVGNMCSVSTDDANNGSFGYKTLCPQTQQAKAVKRHKKSRS